MGGVKDIILLSVFSFYLWEWIFGDMLLGFEVWGYKGWELLFCIED